MTTARRVITAMQKCDAFRYIIQQHASYGPWTLDEFLAQVNQKKLGADDAKELLATELCLCKDGMVRCR